MYEVLSPLGERVVQAARVVRRPSDLNGKTIGMVTNGAFRSDIIFPIVQELLQKRFPDVRVIPFTEFPIHSLRGSTRDLLGRIEVTVAALKKAGCDGVITGVGA
jgi:hypothetical protein